MFRPPNVYIIGAQCTGKTTLVNALEQFFQQEENREVQRRMLPAPIIIREVARAVLRDHGFAANDITSSKRRSCEIQERILQAQWRAESTAVDRSWIISDRSAVDPVMYAAKYVDSDAATCMMQSSTWMELRSRMQGSLVIVCEPGMTWLTDDGVRLMPTSNDDWVSLHQLCCQILDKAEISYCILPKSILDLDKRVGFVLERWALTRARNPIDI